MTLQVLFVCSLLKLWFLTSLGIFPISTIIEKENIASLLKMRYLPLIYLLVVGASINSKCAFGGSSFCININCIYNILIIWLQVLLLVDIPKLSGECKIRKLNVKLVCFWEVVLYTSSLPLTLHQTGFSTNLSQAGPKWAQHHHSKK